MAPNEILLHATNQLFSAMRNRAFCGHDPYDGLLSPLIQGFTDKRFRARFIAQQLIKRFPFDLSGILGIPTQENPVTLALTLQSLTHLSKAGIISSEEENKLQTELIQRIKAGQSHHFEVPCWGYPFEWQARYALVPKNYPTIVSTGIVTNALYSVWQKNQDKETGNWIVESCRFVTDHLNRSTTTQGQLFFSYSPSDKEKVLNASGKAVRLLAQGFHISKNPELMKLASKAAQSIVSMQQTDGSWPYSLRNTGGWIDNYHTAYLLDCLNEYALICKDERTQQAIQLGFNYYKDHFFSKNGHPKLFHNKTWPVDCTAAGQSLLTLVRFGAIEQAIETAGYMVRNMQKTNGHFAYRKYRFMTDQREFMRWSDAWMLAGLSVVLSAQPPTA